MEQRAATPQQRHQRRSDRDAGPPPSRRSRNQPCSRDHQAPGGQIRRHRRGCRRRERSPVRGNLRVCRSPLSLALFARSIRVPHGPPHGASHRLPHRRSGRIDGVSGWKPRGRLVVAQGHHKRLPGPDQPGGGTLFHSSYPSTIPLEKKASRTFSSAPSKPVGIPCASWSKPQV